MHKMQDYLAWVATYTGDPRVKGQLHDGLETFSLCVWKSGFAKLTVGYTEDRRIQKIVWNSVVCYK